MSRETAHHEKTNFGRPYLIDESSLDETFTTRLSTCKRRRVLKTFRAIQHTEHEIMGKTLKTRSRQIPVDTELATVSAQLVRIPDYVCTVYQNEEKLDL